MHNPGLRWADLCSVADDWGRRKKDEEAFTAAFGRSIRDRMIGMVGTDRGGAQQQTRTQTRSQEDRNRGAPRTCFHCHKEGHEKKDCKAWKEHKAKLAAELDPASWSGSQGSASCCSGGSPQERKSKWLGECLPPLPPTNWRECLPPLPPTNWREWLPPLPPQERESKWPPLPPQERGLFSAS